jgi:hypothetical protein
VVVFHAGVPHTNASLLAQCANAARSSAAVARGAFAGPDPPPTLAFLPNFHVIGFVLNFLFPHFVGAPCAVHAECEATPLSLPLLLGAAAALAPATVDTVPALLEELARAPELAAAAAPFAGRAVAYGGAPLAAWAEAKLRAAGVFAFSQYVCRSFVFDAPSLAQIAVVRADSLTGAHLYSRSRRLSEISLDIVRLRVHLDVNTGKGTAPRSTAARSSSGSRTSPAAPWDRRAGACWSSTPTATGRRTSPRASSSSAAALT